MKPRSRCCRSSLSQVADLKVPARTSSFAFKGKAEDVRGIGATLGVANLLEGSVQKSGDEVRITAQLVRTSDGTHVWSKHFDRKLTDVFKIQDEIATEVVGALKVSLVGNAEQRLIQKRTENVAAYQEYLKGIALMPERKVADLRAAAAHFQRAVELDPGFARAYVGVGDAYALLSEYGSVTEEERNRGRQYIERALELAPELGEAHASLAARLAGADDLVGAEREYKRAIELAPSYATAYHWYSELLQDPLARPDEALAMATRAVALDPLSPVLQMNLADMQAAAGHQADARATVTRLAAAHPEYALAHRAEAQYAAIAGDLVAALRAMQAHDRADPDAIGYGLARCEILFDFGARDAMHACVADFARRAPAHPRVLHAQAEIASVDGELERSVALYESTPQIDPVDHAVALLRVRRAPEALKLLETIAPKLTQGPAPELSSQQRPLAAVVGATLLQIEGAQGRGRALVEQALAAKGAPSNRVGGTDDGWFEPICFELLGRRNEALAALQHQIAAGRFVRFTHIDWEPLLKPLRSDPRWRRPRGCCRRARVRRSAGTCAGLSGASPLRDAPWPARLTMLDVLARPIRPRRGAPCRSSPN